MKVAVTLLVVVCVLTSSIDAKKKNKKRGRIQAQILNGEEENSADTCAKVCSGTTGRRVTDYQAYGSNVYVDVDMTGCGFTKVPNVVISVEGSSRHWVAEGTSSVYNSTPTSFRVYLKNESSGVAMGNLNAEGYQWNIDWIAVGFTC